MFQKCIDLLSAPGEVVWKSKLFKSILFSVAVFLVLLVFWNQPAFASDESEIFVKGLQIARGELLYQHVDSQHMPLMYHIAAVFAGIGVSGTAGFRTLFYGFFAVLSGMIYYRYSSHFGSRMFVVTLLIYSSVLPTMEHGTAILGEHLQGLGMVIFILELLLFEERRKMDWRDYVFCSIGAFISFGSIFVSIFGIFAFYVCMIALMMEEGTGRQNVVQACVKNCIMIAFAMAVPFALYSLYFIKTGTVKELYQWAYLFNRKIYPKYLKNGYGSSILGGLFSGVSNIAETFVVDNISTTAVIDLLIVCISICFIIEIWKKNRVFACLLMFFINTCATRDAFAFHGIAVVAVFSVIAGYEFNLHYLQIKKWVIQSGAHGLIAGFLLLTLCSGLFRNVKWIFFYTNRETYNTATSAYALRLLGEDYEEIGYFNLDHDLLLRGKKLPANPTWGICPWFWEWEKDLTMDVLEDKKPRLFCYISDSAVWDYRVSDFAPEIARFLASEYTELKQAGYPGLYARNDYYYESVCKLEGDKAFSVFQTSDTSGEILAGDVICQPFTSYETRTIKEIDLMMGCFKRSNTCQLVISIKDEETGKTTELARCSCQDIMDNSYRTIKTIPYELVKNRKYTVNITSPDGKPGNAVAVYHAGDAVVNDYRAIERGQQKTSTIAMNIICESDFRPAVIVAD